MVEVWVGRREGHAGRIGEGKGESVESVRERVEKEREYQSETANGELGLSEVEMALNRVGKQWEECVNLRCRDVILNRVARS